MNENQLSNRRSSNPSGISKFVKKTALLSALALVALPGVNSESVEAVIDDGDLVIAGARTYPPALRTAVIHRLELPQGRFERGIPLPAGRYSAIHRSDSNGTLLITLEKSVASNG